MLRLGVTGGIGTGKSLVCQIFASLGAPIYDADKRAKELYLSNTKLKDSLVNRYGSAIYIDRKLNKELLASKVFTDSSELEWLNSIVHPLIFEDYETWCQENDGAIYTVKEAAIMFESGSDKHVDYIIGIASPEELRIKRVMKRDSISAQDVKNRMAKQMPQEELLNRCNFVIKNDEEQSLINQVLALHKKFITPGFRL